MSRTGTSAITGKIDNFDLSKSKGNHPVYSYFSHLIFCEVYKRFNKNEVITVDIEGYSIRDEDYVGDLEYKVLVEERLLDIGLIVDKLNGHQKVLYRLYFIDDLDMKEIACQLEVSNMFVFQQLRDLRIEIRNQLGLTGELPKIRQRKRLS